MSNGAAPRIARWLSREIFAEDVRGDVVQFHVLDGAQLLTTYKLLAGDDANTIAGEISEALATYFDGAAKGHTFHVQPIFREGCPPRVGKLAVKITPADLESSALATVGASPLAAAQAGPDSALASWQSQARFNASQVGALTETVIKLSKSTGEQFAIAFGAMGESLKSLQQQLELAHKDNAELRAQNTKLRAELEDSRELSREAVKEAERLAEELKTERETSKVMQPLIREVSDQVGGTLGITLLGVVKDAVAGAQAHQAANQNGKATNAG